MSVLKKLIWKKTSKIIWLKTKLYLGQKQFANLCEFCLGKYSEYKNILTEKYKKLSEGIEIIDKVKSAVEVKNKEIEDSSPLRQELDKIIEETRKSIGDKAREKKEWVTKKQQEEIIKVPRFQILVKPKFRHEDERSEQQYGFYINRDSEFRSEALNLQAGHLGPRADFSISKTTIKYDSDNHRI